jgi:hypothetical protein
MNAAPLLPGNGVGVLVAGLLSDRQDNQPYSRYQNLPDTKSKSADAPDTVPAGSERTSAASAAEPAVSKLTYDTTSAHGHQVATAIQRLQALRHLQACSGCVRLERMPGGMNGNTQRGTGIIQNETLRGTPRLKQSEDDQGS